MSFSSEIKEELVKLDTQARHCQIAELAAILIYSGAIKMAQTGDMTIDLASDAPFLAQRCHILWHFLSQGKVEAGMGDADSYRSQNSNAMKIPVEKVVQTIKYVSGDLSVNSLVLKSLCCKRAYVRGAFLASGSMSNPQKGYHLEFVCEAKEQASQLIDVLGAFDIRAKMVTRKRYRVVYIKESEEIVEILNVMGAHVALMNLENLRILKDMRNSINRQVNCEAANITKTVNAAAKQIEDIQYIKEHYGFENLPDHLRQMAQIRIEHPDATLKELGEYLTPAVGKSGVNHRLRKLSELAKERREAK